MHFRDFSTDEHHVLETFRQRAVKACGADAAATLAHKAGTAVNTILYRTPSLDREGREGLFHTFFVAAGMFADLAGRCGDAARKEANAALLDCMIDKAASISRATLIAA